jgi:hypothetical protein
MKINLTKLYYCGRLHPFIGLYITGKIQAEAQVVRL